MDLECLLPLPLQQMSLTVFLLDNSKMILNFLNTHPKDVREKRPRNLPVEQSHTEIRTPPLIYFIDDYVQEVEISLTKLAVNILGSLALGSKTHWLSF